VWISVCVSLWVCFYLCVYVFVCYLSMHFDILMSFHVFADFAQKVCATFFLFSARFEYIFSLGLYSPLSPSLTHPHTHIHLTTTTTTETRRISAASEAPLLMRLEFLARQSSAPHWKVRMCCSQVDIEFAVYCGEFAWRGFLIMG